MKGLITGLDGGRKGFSGCHGCRIVKGLCRVHTPGNALCGFGGADN